MSAQGIHLDVDLTVDGAGIAGTVVAGSSPPRAFSGRLGLLMAIEHAIEQAQEAPSSWSPGVVRPAGARESEPGADPWRSGPGPATAWTRRGVAS